MGIALDEKATMACRGSMGSSQLKDSDGTFVVERHGKEKEKAR